MIYEGKREVDRNPFYGYIHNQIYAIFGWYCRAAVPPNKIGTNGPVNIDLRHLNR
jgi:hypothetical protein